jgi:hypothetical protein
MIIAARCRHSAGKFVQRSIGFDKPTCKTDFPESILSCRPVVAIRAAGFDNAVFSRERPQFQRFLSGGFPLQEGPKTAVTNDFGWCHCSGQLRQPSSILIVIRAGL